ncbi:flagellar protein FliO/FliZ [Methylophilus rhizosphaerae]|uniref:Flagellar protein n=1 Tax=Methylophilus rhizosphaerae TaxID=492660 RepID=A0A1G8ZE03_9PROT|nr:flagellar biosynthetic protein FliO [Methylophilus rhizosphaerae]SDK12635.1 flagellar protein FliO/FliZ [Methylophilus rhizosphaerae]
MKTFTRFALFFSSLLPGMALAAEPASLAAASAPSAGDSLGRMVLGTVIVLLVIAAIAWLLRRVMPGQGLSHTGIIKQVGGVQLGPRERVVVLEVAGRWLVVGVGPGQMTALGEVIPPSATPAPAIQAGDDAVIDPQASFAVRLQQAMQHTLQQTVKSFKNKP